MIISNTEVSTYNLCKRQHYYQYHLKIEPRKSNLYFRRGIVGHSALEAYYRAMQLGYHLEYCKQAAFEVIEIEIARAVAEDPDDFIVISMLVKLKELFSNYITLYGVEPFEVVAVEEVFTAPLADGIEYGVRLDLLVQFTKGEFKGDYAVIDHKIIYNFKSPEALALDGQLPKMLKTLRENGYTVTKGIFNQLRHREMKNPKPTDIFCRTTITPNRNEVENIWFEQQETAKEIAENPAPIRRTQVETICKNCAFNPICKADLMGEDSTNLQYALYKPRTSPFTDLVVENHG